jgi:hypothetical protein
MGVRGPLSKTVQGRGAHGHRTRTVVKGEIVAVPVERIAQLPDDIGERGRAVFEQAHALAWISESDWPAIDHLARLEDQWQTFAAALTEHGPLLEEPIVTPKGEVVGTRLVPNPAEVMLRRLEVQISALRDRLGMVPMAKARLGISVATARTASLAWVEREMQMRAQMGRYHLAAEEEEIDIASDH